MDLVASLALITVLLPALGVVALLVRWRMGSPVMFLQTRAGLDGTPFEVFKFRTMAADSDDVPEEVRIGRLGAALRAMSLDELPQLWNVVRGEMSLVGPRPLPVEYLPLYTVEELQRHTVRPGLTGLAQVQGRNLINWRERLQWDVQYAVDIGLLTDLKVLVRTIPLVLSARGVAPGGSPVMPKFQGTQDLVFSDAATPAREHETKD